MIKRPVIWKLHDASQTKLEHLHAALCIYHTKYNYPDSKKGTADSFVLVLAKDISGTPVKILGDLDGVSPLIWRKNKSLEIVSSFRLKSCELL
ncbi:hypothetical protein J6590_085400 [Homalodisca vitripennis]|nr:hypothetical protein J6590_085400 [Homalodisca vitripennis]